MEQLSVMQVAKIDQEKKTETSKGNSEKIKEYGEIAHAQFIEKFGLKEIDYMRSSKEGRYKPTVNEFNDLIISGELTKNEMRLIAYIEKFTIRFDNTYFKAQRKKIQEDLKLTKAHVCNSIKGLKLKGLLFEIPAEKDDYYFYSLNPVPFNGLIVVKDVEKQKWKINKRLKADLKKLTKRNVDNSEFGNDENTEKATLCYQKANTLLSKGFPKNLQPYEITSEVTLLKYILLKYILLNSVSENKIARAIEIQSIFEAEKYPISALRNFIQIAMNDTPKLGGLIYELEMANEHKCDPIHRQPIKKSIVGCITELWKSDLSRIYDKKQVHLSYTEEDFEMIQELKSIFNQYLEIALPAMKNVLPFKKKKQTA